MFNTPHNAEGILEVRQMRTGTCAFCWLFQVDWDCSVCLLVNIGDFDPIFQVKLVKRGVWAKVELPMVSSLGIIDDENVYAFGFEDGSISVSLPFPEVDMNGFEWTALTLS
ncbi:hypothetical protein Goarm_023193 [Gossypium armourianum]|uniref:Uncharacterized protein n=1 Tax=Gossypium armourianum TaxID=34283 RepID=A0A7J9KFD6_9ROSI|nr:hypothetical protein [Gossypium armourianum]